MSNGETKCRTICCASQKGGVAKSVTSTNVGIGLAKLGQKVLIVDLDSQASQTISLGWKVPDELQTTIMTHLTATIENKNLNPKEGILTHNEGVDLMPASIELSSLEMRMMNAMSREFILRTYLSELRPHYDVIVLDCPPNT